MDLYFRTWSLCGEGVGCGIGPWYKEGGNLKNNYQQVVFDCKERDNPKKILNKLLFIALLRYLCLSEMQAARQCGLVD